MSSGSRLSTWPMFFSSFIAGTTTLTRVSPFRAPVGARVGHRSPGRKRLDVDQRNAADLARRGDRSLEQIERPGQHADRHPNRLEFADEVEQALVIGVLGADDNAVSSVAVDHLEGRDAGSVLDRRRSSGGAIVATMLAYARSGA